MTNWLDRTHNARNNLRAASRALSTLADAFNETGNEFIGNRLEELATTIFMNADYIGDAINDHITEELNASRAAIWNALSTALRQPHRRPHDTPQPRPLARTN